MSDNDKKSADIPSTMDIVRRKVGLPVELSDENVLRLSSRLKLTAFLGEIDESLYPLSWKSCIGGYSVLDCADDELCQFETPSIEDFDFVRDIVGLLNRDTSKL